TQAAGNVRAKTGTVSGVSSLAGYCTTSGGRHLAFSIINQGVMKGSYAKALQDRLCVEMCK
ncbi:MAG: D-alanyl-D-alanine carboxypeptidase, partial [Prevotella sp.]|nr:D-alanyl-D-alanine carboxypeptidase [Prevotella sp.]